MSVCSSAHPGFVGLRIALITQDRQRSSAHASTNTIYNKYIETYYVTLRCHLPAVMIGVCEVHEPQRQTSENVLLIYKIARRPTSELTSDSAKLRNINESSKQINKKIKINKKIVKKMTNRREICHSKYYETYLKKANIFKRK